MSPSYVPSQANGPQFLSQLAQMNQGIQALQVALAAISNGQDQYGNTKVLIGPNLNQTVMIGSTLTGDPLTGQVGVQVGTGLTGGGIAWRTDPPVTTSVTNINNPSP